MKNLLTKIINYPLIQFYKLESKFWRELYHQQRGGKEYNKLQNELVELKTKLRNYENI